TQHIFAVACDMPYLDERLIRYLAARRDRAEVIIPEGEVGLEPLHAVYSKGCLPHMEAALLAGRRRIVSFFDQVELVTVPRSVITVFDPELRSFSNINTPGDYYALRGAEQGCVEEIIPQQQVSR
ncbi:MAG TPA: molybdenum cofactor guanylyltransferase, partial [Geobacteraceae bacterium]|nr:molybdenum cofactor guanylyltransferase [Geobacteraceae bacterium]